MPASTLAFLVDKHIGLQSTAVAHGDITFVGVDCFENILAKPILSILNQKHILWF